MCKREGMTDLPVPVPVQLQLLDVLVSQSRINERVAEALSLFSRSADETDSDLADVRESVGSVAAEVARINARLESLTQTVGRLMALVEPPPELHSVKVPE